MKRSLRGLYRTPCCLGVLAQACNVTRGNLGPGNGILLASLRAKVVVPER